MCFRPRSGLLILLIVASFFSPVSSAIAAQDENTLIERQFTSYYGIEYRTTFDTDSHVLDLRALNPSDTNRDTVVYISIDRTIIRQYEIYLRPADKWTTRLKLRPELDGLENVHTVTVSTIGTSTNFSFDYVTRFEDPNGVKVPRITNVSVGNARIDGRPSAVVNVTVVNPSAQTYPTKLMVHTSGTDGSFYLPSVGPRKSETITVELLDEQNGEIAGEARLYAGEFNESDGGIHQVGFVGRAGDDTVTWNESYEPVAAPWSENPYRYTNDSIDGGTSVAERVSDGHEVGGVPIIYPAIAIAGLGFALARFR